MFQRLSSILAVAAIYLLTGATAAHATAIDFTGLGNNAVVTVGGTINSGTFHAGELNWTWVGAPPAGFSSSFYTYCVDLAHYLVDIETVTPRATDDLHPLAPSGGEKAAWLLDTYAPAIRSANNGDNAAALQVAIWEALYDATPNLSIGNFTLVTTGAIRTQAQTYLSALYTAPGVFHTADAMWLDVPVGLAGQDQITLVPAPEPLSLVLLGTGLLGLATKVRSRRSL